MTLDLEIRLTTPGEGFAVEGTVVDAAPGDVLLHITDGDEHKTILFEPEQARAAGMALVRQGALGLQAKYGPVAALKRILSGKGTAEIEKVDPDHV
jgi:hypothetical protein